MTDNTRNLDEITPKYFDDITNNCFYRRMNGDIVSEKVFDPSKVYKEGED